MSYYQGDFYRGDPGFFSTLLNVGKGILGAVTGIPMPGGAKVLPAALPAASSVGTKLGAIVKAGKAGIVKHPVLSAAAAAGTIGAVGGGLAGRAMARPRVGSTGGFRKRRRMNPCNGRALRRAIRRAHAFERIAKRVIGFSSPRKPKGHMYFKRKRKK